MYEDLEKELKKATKRLQTAQDLVNERRKMQTDLIKYAVEQKMTLQRVANSCDITKARIWQIVNEDK